MKSEFTVLGVSFNWEKRKGLDVFIQLAKMLDERYHIVLVGTDSVIDQQLPSNIKSIHQTSNLDELRKLYTSADVFVNPTREENFPTVNIEALACGTPVVTFITGGSAEIIDPSCGIAIRQDDIEGIRQAIIRTCEDAPFSTMQCRRRALQFEKTTKFQEYIALYNELAGEDE